MDASTEATDAAPAFACPTNLPGPALVLIGDVSFCIDSTEVTNAQYDEFVTAVDGGADASFLDASAFDGSVLPSSCYPRTGFLRKPEAIGRPNAASMFVDSCDAHAYCAWVGKRVCRAVVLETGPSGEWYRACSREGSQSHPYGNDAEADRCNVSAGKVVEAASHPGGEGGYAGIFDMVGNVAEWVDDCVDARCRIYGGCYNQPSASCTTTADKPFRTNQGYGVGFRCCR